MLDWELATLGEPLADLGLLLFYWRQSGEAKPVLTPAPSMLPGFPPRSYLAERYARRTGADLADLPAWVALAHFKCAVIAQGIAARGWNACCAQVDPERAVVLPRPTG